MKTIHSVTQSLFNFTLPLSLRAWRVWGKYVQTEQGKRHQAIDMSEYVPPGCAIDKKQVLLIKCSLMVFFSCCSTFNTFLYAVGFGSQHR